MGVNTHAAKRNRPATSADAVAVLPVAVILVTGLALTYVSTIAPAGLHTGILMGDIDTAAALVVVGTLIFPVATTIACRIDRLTTPRVADHFKQCSILYVLLIIGAVALLRGRDARGSVGYGVGGVVVVAAAIGILANALTLTVRRWRPRAI